MGSNYQRKLKHKEKVRARSLLKEQLLKRSMATEKIKDEPTAKDLEEIEDDVCPLCGGTGEVISMEAVYPGEPHMADIGTQKCICRLDDVIDEL